MAGLLRNHIAPLALTLLVTFLAFAPAASAQSAPGWKDMSVSIYPEYDQPSVFVNYEGTLADNVTLPATIRLALPKGFQVNSACEIDANGQHTVVNHTETTGDNPGVSYPTSKKDTHIEFYYNPIQGAGKRDLTYKFVAPGAIESLVIDVQQPLRSTAFAVSPASKQVLSGKDGFKYHRYEYSNVTAGQTITFNVSYEKGDAKPSVEPQAQTAAAGAGVTGGDYAVPFVLLGLGLVGLAVFFFTRSRAKPARRMAYAAAPGARRKAAGNGARAVGAAAAANAGEPSAGFCTQCGKRLRPGAAFCPTCGHAVRRGSSAT